MKHKNLFVSMLHVAFHRRFLKVVRSHRQQMFTVNVRRRKGEINDTVKGIHRNRFQSVLGPPGRKLAGRH
jgi:hypothetical protein